MRLVVLYLIALATAWPLPAQKQHREPLTDAESQKIAEAGIDPNERIGLYTKFLNDHADTIKALIPRRHSEARTQQMDNDLQDFSALMDELGSNLDQYGDRKADMRKSLKELNEAIPRWQQMLKDLPSEPGFEVSRQDAIDGCNDLADETRQLISDQTEYFKLHKNKAGQEREEPD